MVDALGHFPLQHFWGPVANVKSTAWIVDSAVLAAKQYRPNLFYVYLPHLDYAPQKHGPDSAEARQALVDLDDEIGKLVDGFSEAYADQQPLWLVASEYVITPVEHVSYPNRALREAGLLVVREEADGEHLDLANSRAWAMVDHQFSRRPTFAPPKTCLPICRAWRKFSLGLILTSTTWGTFTAENWWSSRNPAVGRLIIGGWKINGRPVLLGRSTSTASQGTTPWNFFGTLPARAFRWMRPWCAVRMVPRPASHRSAAFCSLPSEACLSSGHWRIPTWQTSCCGNLGFEAPFFPIYSLSYTSLQEILPVFV